jgi:hypothetical protein
MKACVLFAQGGVWIGLFVGLQGALAGPPSTDIPLVPKGAVWKYQDAGTDQGIAWREATFDDGTWPLGPAQLGYGDGDEVTVVGFGSDPNTRAVTTYFRHVFPVTNANSITGLTVRLLRDDGGVVYLNGSEVFRSNMPLGPVSHTTLATVSVCCGDESTNF